MIYLENNMFQKVIEIFSMIIICRYIHILDCQGKKIFFFNQPLNSKAFIYAKRTLNFYQKILRFRDR